MTRTAILILSLLWSASLGAAQDSPVDCGDGTHCPDKSFCSQPAGSSRMVCANVYSNSDLCDACASLKQVCLWQRPGQVSCLPSVSCDTACPVAGQICALENAAVEGANQGACLPLSSANASEPMVCGWDEYCPVGTFCYYDETTDKTLCAPQSGNDVLCTACTYDLDEGDQGGCYPGSGVGLLACKVLVNCADDCDDVNNEFCVKTNASDAEGMCFKYSEKNSS